MRRWRRLVLGFLSLGPCKFKGTELKAGWVGGSLGKGAGSQGFPWTTSSPEEEKRVSHTLGPKSPVLGAGDTTQLQ